MKGIVAPEIGPKSFWTFENQATGPTSSCSVEDTTLTARQITIEQTTPMVLIESHVGFSAVMIASHVRNEYAVFFCWLSPHYVNWLYSHVACSHGHLSCVKFLLRQPGVDVHVRDRWRASPLYGEFLSHAGYCPESFCCIESLPDAYPLRLNKRLKSSFRGRKDCYRDPIRFDPECKFVIFAARTYKTNT